MALLVSEKSNTTLTIKISDQDDAFSYTVEHSESDRSIYVEEVSDIARKTVLSATPAVARAIAAALLKCADKAEGKVVNHDPTIATDAALYGIICDRIAALENGEAAINDSEHDALIAEAERLSRFHGDLWAEAYLLLHPQGGTK